jgi:hypothetical protein
MIACLRLIGFADADHAAAAPGARFFGLCDFAQKASEASSRSGLQRHRNGAAARRKTAMLIVNKRAVVAAILINAAILASMAAIAGKPAVPTPKQSIAGASADRAGDQRTTGMGPSHPDD